jgi:hypothetical protein
VRDDGYARGLLSGLLRWVPTDAAGLTLQKTHEWLLAALSDPADHVRHRHPLASVIAPSSHAANSQNREVAWATHLGGMSRVH